jgi:redox-sensitive bicupin YhaK (pirin superfamily)
MPWQIRKSSERGHFDHGWLKTWHSFSFSQYWDRKWMGFRALRVINQDIVAPGEGFDPHPHDNMEIVTVILDGALRHQDSMGNGSTIRPGDIQRMSAGTGVVHSEFNDSSSQGVHLLQIWIIPDRNGIPPSYEQKHVSTQERRNRLAPLVVPASRDRSAGSGFENAVIVHQDTSIFASVLDRDHELVHQPSQPRHFWLQLVTGSVRVNGMLLEPGDAAYTTAPAGDPVAVRAEADSQFLLFELA